MRTRVTKPRKRKLSTEVPCAPVPELLEEAFARLSLARLPVTRRSAAQNPIAKRVLGQPAVGRTRPSSAPALLRPAPPPGAEPLDASSRTSSTAHAPAPRVGPFDLRLTHIGVPVLSLPASRRFWQDTLGLTSAVKQPDAEGIHWVELEDQQFHLFENSKRGDAAVTTKLGADYDPSERTFVFAAKDLRAVEAKLTKAELASHLESVGTFGPALVCQDPNGYWVAFQKEEAPDACVLSAKLPLTRFLGIQLPAVSARAAVLEMGRLFGLPALSGDQPGVEAGGGRKVTFTGDRVAAVAQSTLEAGVAREFHLNFDGNHGKAREHLMKLHGEQSDRLIDASVRFAGEEGGACQTFAWNPPARLLLEVSEIVEAEAACPSRQGMPNAA